MQRQARVIAINNQTGLIGLQPEGEDSCVLAQQLDTRPVNTGQMLSGEMDSVGMRSEEHTSELQSQSNLVCRLLLEKKKNEERPAKGRRCAIGDGFGKLVNCRRARSR